jgi:predicted GIY-YIG superfamily endonuclease
MQGIGKRFVYVLRSEFDQSRHYVGVTTNVEERLWWHNNGPDGQTIRYRPWRLLVTIEFADEPTAIRFERYLKSASGRAFAKKRLAPAD